MAPRIGEHCENCLKHSGNRHKDGQPCGRCLPRDGDEGLRRCASCKLVRYCSRDCQKAHWKQHKQYCSVNVHIQRMRETMGPTIAERQKTFEKWCNKNVQFISLAGLSALEIMKNRERTETHVFLVYLNVVEQPLSPASSKPRYIRSVREAHCSSMSRVHQLFGQRFTVNSYAILERDLAPRPKMMRMLVIDEGLPHPLDLYTLPIDIGDDVSTRYFDVNWFKHLKLTVDDR